jgi:hypothetical protein
VSGDLRRRSYQVLLCGARKASPSVRYNRIGYASHWEENLADNLPLTPIISDLSAGAGCELDSKLRAAHSSAALAINTFGPWRIDPPTLQVGGVRGFHGLKFEATCPTGLGGTPPHLDLIAEGEVPVAVESKCTNGWRRRLRSSLLRMTTSSHLMATHVGLNRFDSCKSSPTGTYFSMQHSW